MIDKIKMELEPGELSLRPCDSWIREIQMQSGKDIEMQGSPAYLSRNSFVNEGKKVNSLLDKICVFSVMGGE